jgi:hypothetical protein
MGRTIPSFRIALEEEIASWREFRASLGSGSRRLLDRLFNESRNYCSASSNSVRPVKFEGMLMGMIASHERRLEMISVAIEQTRREIHVRDQQQQL